MITRIPVRIFRMLHQYNAVLIRKVTQITWPLSVIVNVVDDRHLGLDIRLGTTDKLLELQQVNSQLNILL